jgi:hypothetical protein
MLQTGAEIGARKSVCKYSLGKSIYYADMLADEGGIVLADQDHCLQILERME